MTAVASRRSVNNPISPSHPEAISRVSRFLQRDDQESAATSRLVGPDGESVEIPAEIYDILKVVVKEMQAGHAVSITPLTQRITTQEAADLLGVSRPTLVKLVETGAIAYEKPGRHRRLLLTDVIDYRNARHREAMLRLDELTGEASEAGLYDTSPANYQDALKQARAGFKRSETGS